jgi:hypothetical protein
MLLSNHIAESPYFSIGFSPNGWTDRELCESWFMKDFVNFAASQRICDKPIVLNYDGHDSHETVEMQRIAFDNGIILFAFPSKTTHKTQPLDVSVFSAVQDAWSYRCDKRVAEGITMDRYNVIHEYLQVRHVVTPELIKTAFRKTGIYPLNPDIFTADDFAPSKSFSTVAHVPTSFPYDVPSSPPAQSSDLDSDTSDEEYLPPGSDFDSENDGYSDSDAECEVLCVEDGFEIIDFGSDVMEDIQTDPLPILHDPHFNTFDMLENPLDDNEVNYNFSELPIGDSYVRDFDNWNFDTVPDTQPRASPSLNSHSRSFSTYSTRSTSSSTSLFDTTPTYLSLTEDQQKSHKELVDEVRHLRNQVNGLASTISMQAAELGASNAHCTIIKRELGEVRTQLENMRAKKNRGSNKIKGRILTLPEMKAAFDTQEVVRLEKEKTDREKEAQKTSEALERNAQITQDIVLKIFDKPLTSYKRKDELVTIAGALKILATGTNPELFSRIKDHLTTNPQLKQTDRFAGLFNVGRRRGLVTMSHESTQSEPTSATLSDNINDNIETQVQAPKARPRPRPIARKSAPLLSETGLQLPSESSSDFIHPLAYRILSSTAGSSRTPNWLNTTDPQDAFNLD